MQDTMIGSKGGGGKFTQKPDNLRSNDTFEGLLGLCTGPIKGPVLGMKSIRINGTPIEANDGTENFPGVVANFADGDPLKFPQVAELRLGSAGAPTVVGVDIANTNSAAPGPWVSRALNNTGAEFIDLRFIVNQLFKQTKKGVFENTLRLEIQMKPQGSATWINPFNPNGNTTPTYSSDGYETSGFLGGILKVFMSQATYTKATTSDGYLVIKGKTTSPFVKELRVQVPNTDAYANKAWDVQVRLIEKDSVDADPNFEKRNVQWESMTAVYSSKLGQHEDWRGLCWVQIYGKASDNFNGLPSIDGIYDTKIVSVPPISVFNPETRIYSGATWDGSWAKAYTNDPAWIINDAITDAISGMAALIPGAHLNKWDALELSKWCSTPVPDGKGGTEPRFSLNVVADTATKSDEFIRNLAGACGATAWDNGAGEWRLKVDKPQTAAAVFSHENIEGEFAYAHTDVDTRFNDITVVFLNAEFDYREDWVKVTNDADITKNGRKPTRIVAIGCTSRQQALRWATQRLRTNLNEFRMVSFVTNRQGKYFERFDHILIADSSLNNTDTEDRRTTGRIIGRVTIPPAVAGGADTQKITVRDPMRLEVGVAYKLVVTIPNPAYNPKPATQPTGDWAQPTITVTRNVTNDAAQRGDVTDIYLDSPLPTSVAENANVALEATALPAIPRVYRILDIELNPDGERVAVAAIEVDSGKWNAADNATQTQVDWDMAFGEAAPPRAPAGGIFNVDVYQTDISTRRMLQISWERPPLGFTVSYTSRYRINQGPWRDLGTGPDTTIELQNPEPGVYDFEVFATDRRDRRSLPLAGTITLEELVNVVPGAYLTNEAHTVATAPDGTGGELTTAGGTFKLITTAGPVVGAVFSVFSETGVDVSIDPVTGVYTVVSMSADQAVATFRAVLGDVTIDKTYSIARSRAGTDGKGGPLIALSADGQAFSFQDTVAVNASQLITLTASRQNTSEIIEWSSTPTVTLGTTADPLQRTVSIADFGANRQVTITAAGVTSGLKDRITLVRLDKSSAAANAGTSLPLTQYGTGSFDRRGNSIEKLDNDAMWTGGFSSAAYLGNAFIEARFTGLVAGTKFAELALDNVDPVPTPSQTPSNSGAPVITGLTTEGSVLTVTAGTWTNVDPENTVTPVISGTAQENSTLSVTTGTWSNA